MAKITHHLNMLLVNHSSFYGHGCRFLNNFTLFLTNKDQINICIQIQMYTNKMYTNTNVYKYKYVSLYKQETILLD